ncbi:hypothetical protein DH2020_027152 [Rehmannia glutinosa]|uniref:VTT domain-containing protein n=1 Tax=Rehmannia glutinosa TaxID=99300 RepID=A0ABR0VYR6_REHGL
MRVVGRRWWMVAALVALAGVVVMRKQVGKQFGWDNGKDSAVMQWLREMSDHLGYWAIPVYVGIHTLTLALCLPYAVFFEAGASMLFGFLPALLCVFSAKVMGISLVHSLLVFRNSGSAAQWVQKNKYFHVLSRGVERDGWKFVLLARFSPVPSYIINYALAATKVGFVVDFLVPTVIGCLPMILQNTSIGSLAIAAVASASAPTDLRLRMNSRLVFFLGVGSGFVLSCRSRSYSVEVEIEDPPSEPSRFFSHQRRPSPPHSPSVIQISSPDSYRGGGEAARARRPP